MSQTQEAGSTTIDVLRSAVTTGQSSVLKEVKADAVLLHVERVLPVLLQLCDTNESVPNLALLNAAWKLLLSVASHSSIDTHVYSRVMQFMFAQLQHHIFSHDWSDGKKVKIAAFVASHVVSAVRAHPYYAARDTELIGTAVEMYTTVCLTVATSAHMEAARQLHQNIGVRLLAILEAIGSACDGPRRISAEELLQILLRCLEGPSQETTAVLPSGSAAAGAAVAALTATMAVVGPLLLVCDRASAETLLTAFLLWLPDMQHVLLDVGESEAASSCEEEEPGALLHRRVARQAKHLPCDLFTASRESDEATDSTGEVGLETQLLLLLRGLACKSVDAAQLADVCDGAGMPTQGSLLRCRVFGLLMAALLVPNDSSIARVLLVWEAVLHHLSDLNKEILGAELLQLGEDQLRALREIPSTMPQDKVDCLHRFLNATAALLAEICRLLHRPPEALTNAASGTSASQTTLMMNAPFYSPNQLSFCSMVSCLYHQSRTYQWWNEEAAMKEETTHTVETALHDELQAVLAEWQRHSSAQSVDEEGEKGKGNNGVLQQRLRAALVSVPGRLSGMLQQSAPPGSITAVLLVATRLLQSITEAASTSSPLRVCARFVAAELLAVAGLAPCDDPTFLACVRRLVDLSFSAAAAGADTQAEGMARYHAAVCLRNFVQRNTMVPLDKLRLSAAATAALMSLLQGKVADAVDVDVRRCEGLIAHRVEAWECLVSRCSQMTSSDVTIGSLFDLAPPDASAQSSASSSEARFLLPLQRCEDTLRAVLQWREGGRLLRPAEESALSRVEQLVCAVTNVTRATVTSAEEMIDSSADAVRVSGVSPEFIHVD
ncbi:hypothetical protein DQ04_12221000 [Trypanosoma grayi]|uniref:hypothetical protein n=1 Tax=Trypanosoma grayi TaxID=71804 RepID=UPI0004F3F7D5|nr:hypothetical protein DQ04_12221000 [Trypanosoma grayi]KEG06794.1 hypothetical protein DQ04_12221000 [Trypanosoma grayi]